MHPPHLLALDGGRCGAQERVSRLDAPVIQDFFEEHDTPS
ncbi:hypothetical protein QFZ33_004056 [Arthrobacter globiformis]|nr:hypothetical protein [Arthrobacter globiformis]